MLSDSELDALADRVTDRLLGKFPASGRLILPSDPTPPAPPKDPVDWAAVRVQLFHILQIILTIGAAVLSGYAAKYGINASGTAEQAVQQSAANSQEIQQAHAENVARIEAVHKDVKKTDQKLADVARAAAAPRPFTLPGGFDPFAAAPKDAAAPKKDGDQ